MSAPDAKPFAAHYRDDGGLPVLRLSGDIEPFHADSLGQAIAAALSEGPARVVIDLTETTFMAASAARCIADLSRLVPARSCTFILRNPNRIVRKALEVAGADGRCLIEDRPVRAGRAEPTYPPVPELTRSASANLEEALVTARPPQPAGMAVAARYVAAGLPSSVGGDWWEVLELRSGRVGIGIGDISGHGIGAAALMGQARLAMRAAGHALFSPAEVLALVDNHLSQCTDQEWGDHTDPHCFATALYGLVDVRAGTLRISSAGHLPALLRPSAGPVESLWITPGPPLGLTLGAYPEATLRLRLGDILVAYTDGLVESRRVDVESGIRHLAAALADCDPGMGVEGLADHLLKEMNRLDSQRDDDLALVVAQLTTPVAGRWD